MRTSLMFVAMLLAGCGGTGFAPELYDVLVDYFTLPDTCYADSKQPTSGVVSQPPRLMKVQVWEGPEDTAYLEIEGGSLTMDMGEAPSVKIDGVFTGKKGDKGWTFVSDTVEKQTLGNNNVFTASTHAEFTFERSRTFRGTGSISSSSVCSGDQCTSFPNRSCAVSSVALSGTRLAVEYQRAP